MPKNKIVKYGLQQALVALAYIAGVVALITYLEKWFGGRPDPQFLAPFAMLTLLVLSVAVMGLTVFGRSVLWYLDGRRAEAVHLLGATIGWLAIAAGLAFSLIIFG